MKERKKERKKVRKDERKKERKDERKKEEEEKRHFGIIHHLTDFFSQKVI